MFETRRRLSASTIASPPQDLDSCLAEICANPVIDALPDHLKRALAGAALPGFRFWNTGEYLVGKLPAADDERASMLPEPATDLILLGRRASVVTKWWWTTQYPTAGWLGGGDALGLAVAFFVAGEAHAKDLGPPRLTSMARLPTRGFRIGPATLEKLGKLDWSEAGGFQCFVRDLGRGLCMAMNPFFDDMLSQDRLRLARTMEVRVADADAVLLDWGDRDMPLGMVLVGGRVRVERRSRSTGHDLGSNELAAGGLMTGMANESDNDVEVRVTAVQHTHYMVLTRRAFVRQMFDAVLSRRVSFSSFRGQLADIVDWEVELAGALAADPLFEGVERAKIFVLLQGAVPRTWRVAQPAPAPVGDIEGFCAVMSGELVGYRKGLPSSQAELDRLGLVTEPAHTYGRGQLIGTYELVMGRDRAPSWSARIPTEVFFVSKLRTWLMFEDDPVFQRNRQRMKEQVLEVMAWHEQTVAKQWGEPIHNPAADLRAQPEVTHLAMCVSTLAILYFHPLQPGRNEVLSYLIDALAMCIADSFDERVCVLELKTGASGRRVAYDTLLKPSMGEALGDCVKHRIVRLHNGDNDEVMDILGRELAKLRNEGGFSYVFVLADEGIEKESVSNVAQRVIFLNTADQPASMDAVQRRGPFLYTTFLPDDTSRVRGAQWPPATVRLKVGLDAVARKTGGRREIVSELLDEERARPWAQRHLARWARAVTNRRVGMALGGGGAWGMAHLAVLEALEYHQVPVDALSGASAGSQMATFYAALGGMEGLQTFLDRRTLWQLVFTLSVLSLEVDAWLNERYVGDMCLEEVALPCFPVTTVLNTASATPILAGPITTALRCSGGLVPVYPSTPMRAPFDAAHRGRHGGATYTDGGFTANVPTAVLRNEGCRLLLASNIVPPPRVGKTFGPLFPGRFGRVMADLNPLRRGYDTVQAALILFFAAGTTAAQDAHTVIQAPWTSILPFDIMAGQALMEEQRSSPTLWQAMDGARNAWEALKAPRVRID